MAALQLEGYQFDEKIGEGGMAAVYRGHQLSLARPVAIKVLNQQLRKHDQAYEAFEREAVIIARLAHPNIVHVIDRGISSDGTPFFIMEYVDGIDLATMLREGALPLQKKIDICIQTCRALSYAHKNQVVHRDIKPANILVNRDFTIKVLDFGIASFLGATVHDEAAMPAAHPTIPYQATTSPVSLTTTGREVMGTINYMAPELQDADVIATAKSDIYSLGVMMFEMFAGHVPSLQERLLPADAVGLPHSISPIIMGCLADAPEKRPDMSALHNQLLLLSRGSHLDKQKAQRAKDSVSNKKSFALLDIVREGSDDAVYLFIEQQSGQQFIVKKFVNNLANSAANHLTNHVANNAELVKRLASLTHPNILRVHGTSKNSRAAIQVMDYAKGGSLQERLVRPFAVNSFLVVAEQLLRGLMFAHKHQILHGNLRPSNVLFDEYERVKLADFGLPPHAVDNAQRTKRQQQRDAAFHVHGEPRCPQSDIYACGVIFYVMLLGQFPRYRQPQNVSSPLDNPRAFRRLPESLQTLLSDMLHLSLSQRPKKVADVLARLQQLNEGMETQIKDASFWRTRIVEKRFTGRWLWFGVAVAIITLIAGTVVIKLGTNTLG